jgi:hypothetical protein
MSSKTMTMCFSYMMVDLVRPDQSKLENEFTIVVGKGKIKNKQPLFSTFQNSLIKALTPSRS